MTIDPTERTELTGPWAGFGFQLGHMWTPEGYSLYPEDMVWWSLTCNIAHEWRQMMADARRPRGQDENDSRSARSTQRKVIYLRDVLRRRQQERSAEGGQSRCEPGQVRRPGRGRRRTWRG
ncbi:DUF3653 domain-containing protein [Xanthomonas sp. LMG 12460]|uniref:DUF3653 domain-containing protein n=1 Tax=Xanthomonas sp. LMG 12460 TaxID=1591132 RepID=UPI00126474C0|nr:DUF3653 domain-containing protein [Xanthomonas sp. LMG 12460]KAB7775675.1 hypothetical protein CEK66_16645 [Xanthomonas sp. LMG 12460]